jgi:hypothetical protein
MSPAYLDQQSIIGLYVRYILHHCALRYALRVAPDDAIHLAEFIGDREPVKISNSQHLPMINPETAALLRWADFMIYLRTLRGLGTELKRPPHIWTNWNEQVPVLTVHGAKGLE